MLREDYNGIDSEKIGDPREHSLYQAGEAINEFVAERAPTNPNITPGTGHDIASGFGSTFGFGAVGAVSRAAKVPGLAGAAVAGAGVGGSASFEEALAGGASLEEAILAFKQSSVVGLSEGLPIARFLDRLDRSSGGSIKRVLLDTAGQGGEEAVQEIFQTVMDNSIAKGIWDPHREVFQGAEEAGGIGLTVGGVMGFLASMIGGRRGAGPAAPDEGAPAPAQSEPDPSDLRAAETARQREELQRVLDDERPVADVLADTAEAEAEAAAPPIEELPQADGGPVDGEPGDGGAGISYVEGPGKMLLEDDWAGGAPYVYTENIARRAEMDGSQAAPIEVKSSADTDEAAAQTDPEPSDGQKEAGNYKHGHIKVHGLDIAIENARGSERSGADADGKPWSVTMPAHYGYVKRTEGADGDHVDVYVGENPQSETVFVVDQMDADTGKFDEHKVMLGFETEEQAREAYRAGFSDGRGDDRLGAITTTDIEGFKSFLKHGDTTEPMVSDLEQRYRRRENEAKQQDRLPEGLTLEIVEDEGGRDIYAVTTPDGQLVARARSPKTAVESALGAIESANAMVEKPAEPALSDVSHETVPVAEPPAASVQGDAPGADRAAPPATGQRGAPEVAPAVTVKKRQFKYGQPMDLVEFVRAQGGLRDDAGHDLAGQYGNVPRDVAKKERFLGGLISPSGTGVDEMGLKAFEAGYFQERPTEAEFLEVFDETFRAENDRRYAAADAAWVEEWRAQKVAEHEADKFANLDEGAQDRILDEISADKAALLNNEIEFSFLEAYDAARKANADRRGSVEPEELYDGGGDAVTLKDLEGLDAEIRASENPVGAGEPSAETVRPEAGGQNAPRAGPEVGSPVAEDAPAPGGQREPEDASSDVEPAQETEETDQGTQTLVPGVAPPEETAGEAPKDLPNQAPIDDTPLFDTEAQRQSDLVEESRKEPETRTAPPDVRASLATPKMRTSRTPWGDFPDVVVHTTVGERDAHPSYAAAKDGDADAALELAESMLGEEHLTRLEEIIGESDPIVLPVIAVERNGTNHIPGAMADYIGTRFGLEVETRIIQSNVAGHTRARAFHRLATLALFEGPVEAGRDYVIVDDHVGLGGTIANLRGHIEAQGGKVIAVTTLTESRDSAHIALRPETLDALREKHGDELESWWRKEFGHGTDTLTEAEAGNLLRAKDVVTIRERISKARERAGEQEVQGIAGEQIDPGGGVASETDDANDGAPAGAVSDSGPKKRASLRSETEATRSMLAANELTDAFADQLPEIIERIHVLALRINPSVSLNLVKELWFGGQAVMRSGASSPDRRQVAGTFNYSRRLVSVAMDLRQFDPISATTHELWHSLEELLTAKERDVLQAAFPATKRRDHEEETAYAFQAYMDGREAAREAGETEKFPTGIGAIFDKILEFLKRVGRMLKSRGFTTVEDIFRAAESGKIGRRGSKLDPGGQAVSLGDGADVGGGTAASLGHRPLPEADIFGNSFDYTSRKVRDVLRDTSATRLARLSRVKGVVATEARQKLQDKYLDLKQIEKAIAERRDVKRLPEHMDAYLAEELYHGITGQKLEEFGQNRVEPLIKAISKADVTLEDVDLYLYARFAPERNAHIAEINKDMPDGGSGMTNAEAAKVIAKFRSDGVLEALEDIASQVYAINSDALDVRVAGGLMTQEQADKWREDAPHYVPLRGWEDIEEGLGMLADRPDGRGNHGRGFDVRGHESKQALGRSSQAESPLTHALAQYEEAVVRAEKNKVGQTFLKLVKMNPNPDLWRVNEIKAKRVIDPETGMVTTRHHRATLGENVLAVKVDGKVTHIEIQHEQLARVMKNVGAGTNGNIILGLMVLNRYLAFINTSLNPEFVLTNFSRDLQTALINMQQHEIEGLTTAVLKDLRPALIGAYGGLRGKESTEWQKHYHDFARAGGKIAFFGLDDIQTRRKRLKRMLGDVDPSKPRQVQIATRQVIDFVQDVNGAVENAVRLATFVNLRRRGVSEKQAASIVRNLTVNFNRKGEWGPVANGLYLFYNAGIQGSATMIGALRHRRVRRIAGATVIGFAFMEMLNYWMSPEDEDGNKLYDTQISEYTKAHNWIFVNPFATGKDDLVAFKVPLPYGYNVFAVTGYKIGEVIRGKTSIMGASLDILLSGINAFNPIGGSDDLSATLVPTVGKPFYELESNRNYLGQSIAPEPNPFGIRKPNSQRYWSNVSGPSREVTKWLNEATGGSEFRPGSIDVSPETLDHLVQWYTGAAGMFVSRSGDFMLKAAAGEEIRWNDVPVARKLVVGHSDWWTYQSYQDVRSRALLFQAEQRGFKRQGRADEAEKLRRKYVVDGAILPLVKRTETSLKRNRSARNLWRGKADISEETRTEKLDAIQEKMVKLMRRVIKQSMATE